MNQATPEKTKAYAVKMEKLGASTKAFRDLGRTGLTTSAIGFGCYRIDDETPLYLAALKSALKMGCNLIDTSTNYTDGGSERCVGNALSELFQTQQLHREEVIVVSKVGYAQGENLSLLRDAEQKGEAYPDVVKYMDGCWHCIQPKFIENNLTRSLERTNLAKIDVYLLHNPEYFFSDALHHNSNTSVSGLRRIFYERIRLAFEQLEKEVVSGRIAHYGVSSNTFGKPLEDGEMTSVSEMWKIANSISKNHHFSVIQLPANLFENGPMLEKNNEGFTALEFAKEVGLGVLVNRPLNAIVQNQLIRLSDQAIRNSDESEISKGVNQGLPEILWKESLSRKCLTLLANTAGVSCVLNGMRRPEYVTDALGILRFTPFEAPIKIYEHFR